MPVVSHLSELQSPWSVWCRSQAPWSVPVVSVVHSPQCLGFGFNIPHTPKGAQGGCPGGEETGAAAAGEFPKVPLRVFFFLRKYSCSILLLPLHKEGPVLSHSPPLQLDPDCWGQGSTWPNSQLSPGAHSLHVFTTLRPYSPPCDFKQPGLSRCCSSLVWQEREPLTQLSPRSPAAGPAKIYLNTSGK